VRVTRAGLTDRSTNIRRAGGSFRTRRLRIASPASQHATDTEL
jgi:hypothetical protein